MSDTPGGASGFDQSAPSRDADADLARREHLNRVMLQAATGDQAAFAELYQLSASRVFGTIVRMLHDHGEAEDLLQEVYTTAWRRIDTFDPTRGGAMTWLITLARNKTIDRLRQHRDAQLDDEQALELPAEDRRPPRWRRPRRSACASSAASRNSIRSRAEPCARPSSAARPTVSWQRDCVCRSEP